MFLGLDPFNTKNGINKNKMGKIKINSFKVKTIKGKRYFVARENGEYKGRRALAGSKISLREAKDIFINNGTFFKNKFKTSNTLTNMKEVSNMKSSSLANRTKAVRLTKPRYIKGERKQVLMYQVSGSIGGVRIIANSQNSYTKSAKGMKAEAWESFLERISQSQGGEYDADEGLRFSKKITDIKEGWIKYTDKP